MRDFWENGCIRNGNVHGVEQPLVDRVPHEGVDDPFFVWRHHRHRRLVDVPKVVDASIDGFGGRLAHKQADAGGKQQHVVRPQVPPHVAVAGRHQHRLEGADRQRGRVCHKAVVRGLELADALLDPVGHGRVGGGRVGGGNRRPPRVLGRHALLLGHWNRLIER